MKKSTTIRSLALCGLSMLLCVSMFVGTTFAWFTDEVTSGNNTIVAGNLDAEVEYYTGNGWDSIVEAETIFDPNARWEPGHAEVVYLRVSNKGNLAFNYKFSFAVEDIIGKTKAGEDIKLSEHLMYGVVDYEEFDSREAAIAAVGADAKPLSSMSFESSLLPDDPTTEEVEADSVETFALVVWMPTTVGNEANHDGVNVPKINLGLTVFATQMMYEEDSFGDDYDKNANSALVISNETVGDLYVYNAADADWAEEMHNQTLEDYAFTCYTFDSEKFQDLYPVDSYGEWICDYFVSTDRAVEEGIFLVGAYQEWENATWYAIPVPVNAVAYDPTPLLGTVTGGESNWTYEGICSGVEVFYCGIVNTNVANEGVGVTVELRMTNKETGEVITVCTIEVDLDTFVVSEGNN